MNTPYSFALGLVSAIAGVGALVTFLLYQPNGFLSAMSSAAVLATFGAVILVNDWLDNKFSKAVDDAFKGPF